MDTYASVNPSYSKGKAYFCEGCVGMKAREVYERANFFPSGNGYPQICIGCAHTSALKHQSFVANHQELVDAFRLSTDFSLWWSSHHATAGSRMRSMGKGQTVGLGPGIRQRRSSLLHLLLKCWNFGLC